MIEPISTTIGMAAQPLSRIVEEGPLIYSMFILIIFLIIGLATAMYFILDNERKLWRELSIELKDELFELMDKLNLKD